MTFVTFSRIRFTASSFSFLDGVVTFYSDGNEGCLVFFFKFFVYIPGLDCYYSVSMATNGRRMTGFSYGRVTISPFFFTMANSMEESLFHDGSFVI